jgi:hypothetical protein
MSEQAQALGSGEGLAGLASFLEETAEEVSEEQEEEAQEADAGTGDEADTVSEASDEQDVDPESPDEGDDAEEAPAPVEKITVKVKGEDGTEETLELTQEDIAASYLRQKDYTKKTQALAERENQAVEFLTQKHEEIRNQFLQRAELTRTAIMNMAGIRSESEMAELASTDPAAWVSESQRQRQIVSYLNELSQQIDGEKQQQAETLERMKTQRMQQQFTQAWQELSKDGFDRPKLAKLYEETSKKYGFTSEELGTVMDHRMVRVLNDAVAYQALKAQKPSVMKKAQSAPRMPSRQAPPAQERIDKALDNKFKSGRAKLNDLAAYLR